MADKYSGRFYAKHGKVWRRPKKTTTEAVTSITVGCQICQPEADFGDDAGAEILADILADMLNEAIDKGIINV